ncbi:MAG: hypothetical protein IT261_11910 [Saprospiraceae bacterium]|nr:hypothetical protein [Saprospiraceae bacterium]
MLKRLQKGDRLQDLDETASSESVFFIREETFQSPWIKIKMPEGQSGWVLAWSVKPLEPDSTWLLRKRMDTYWGKGLRMERDRWLDDFRSMKSQEDWFSALRTAVYLRDTMMQLLHHKPDTEDRLSFRWMTKLLPGFILQESSSSGKPYLFADYRIWLGKAIQCSGGQDDALARCYCSLFPEDSIESRFPIWVFQLGEEEYASQLGLGRHDLVLRNLDVLLQEAPLAKKEIMALKNLILEDILDHSRSYWQSADKIQKELQGIISHLPACLSPDETEAIRIRIKMFQQPELHGIKLNLRSGE